MATKKSIAARSVPEGECLVWTGHINRSGYGSVWHNGQNRDVHRVSYELHHGPIPDWAHVMHKCDNRPCVNPEHMKLGTRYENMMDMFLKGRHRVPQGEKHPNAKLTAEVVAEMRRRFVPYCKTNGAKALAVEFGVTQGAASLAISGATWKGVK